MIKSGVVKKRLLSAVSGGVAIPTQERIKNWLLYGGLRKDEFDLIRGELRKNNFWIMQGVGAMFMLLYFTLAVVGVFMPAFHGAVWANVGSILVCFVFIMSNFTLDKIHPSNTLITIYLFLAYVFIYAAYFSIFQGYENCGVIICAVFLAVPIVITDRPCRIIGFELTALVLYCLCAALCVGDATRTVTLIGDSVSCTVFGFLIASRYTRIKMLDVLSNINLESEATRDGLTGLLNKTTFERDVSNALGEGAPGVFIIADLDDFKRVNDMYGHDVGDDALEGMADCIRQCFRSSDALGRFGGDEFIIFMRGAVDLEVAKAHVERLLALISVHVKLSDETDIVHGSAGIAPVGVNAGLTYDEVFKRADLALYEAKGAGKNQYRVAQ